MMARDLMQTKVITVREEDSGADLCDVFQHAHVHGAPVVDETGHLVGMVCQEDILIGSMAGAPGSAESAENAAPAGLAGLSGEGPKIYPRVRDIMTAPAISATEDTPVEDLCRLMWRLRIHHLPIVREGKVMGMVSSLDVCRAIANGHIQD